MCACLRLPIRVRRPLFSGGCMSVLVGYSTRRAIGPSDTWLPQLPQHVSHARLSGLFFIEIFIWPVVFTRKYRRFNRQPEKHGPCEKYNPREVFDRFTTKSAKIRKYLCIQEMMQEWFYQREVTRREVSDLLTYGFWFKSREQLEAEGQGHLPDQLVDEIESAWGVRFKEEDKHSPSSPFMAHLWQDIRCHYRPLFFYLAIEFLFLVKHVAMRGAGFTCHRVRDQTFYLSPNFPNTADGMKAQDDASTPPFLFLHGVGVGLLPYLGFVFRLLCTGRPVLCIESPHLGMRWVREVPCEEEITETMVEVLDRLEIKAVTCVAHSYGTFFASRLVQRFKDRVQSLVLIDPVCFVMFSGKLVGQFVYRAHEGDLMTWLVARDIHHATSVCRRFYWAQLNLWPDQLPQKTLVVLSANDLLVPVEQSLIMLREEAQHARVMLHSNHKHADFIKDARWQEKVVEETVRMLADTEEAEANCKDALQVGKVKEPLVENQTNQVVTRSKSRKMKGERGGEGLNDCLISYT